MKNSFQFLCTNNSGHIVHQIPIIRGVHLLPSGIHGTQMSNDQKYATIDVIVVISNAITTIMASSNDIAMMITLVGAEKSQFVVLPKMVTYFMVSLTAITVEEVVILGGRMIVLTDITIL